MGGCLWRGIGLLERKPFAPQGAPTPNGLIWPGLWVSSESCAPRLRRTDRKFAERLAFCDNLEIKWKGEAFWPFSDGIISSKQRSLVSSKGWDLCSHLDEGTGSVIFWAADRIHLMTEQFICIKLIKFARPAHRHQIRQAQTGKPCWVNRTMNRREKLCLLPSKSIPRLRQPQDVLL